MSGDLERPGVEVLHPAVVQLARDTELVREIQGRRWPLAAQALIDGATVDQVAEACRLSHGEVRVATYRWMTDGLRDGLLTDEQWAQLSGLLLGEADRSRADVAGE